MIYLDNAATTLRKPQSVKNAVAAAMEHCGNPGRSGHKPAMTAAKVVFNCRETLADFFGMHNPEGVIFTLNATHALNLAIKSLLHNGGHAVVTGYEHNSVVRPLEGMAEKGVSYTVAYSKLFDPQDMVQKIRESILPTTKCVIINHVSNVFGFIAPLVAIDQLCQAHGLPLVLDASQSAGVLPLSVGEYPSLSFVCMPGHKGLYGPQGTGVLLCCKDNCLYSLIEGGTGSNSLQLSQPDFLPDIFESGTPNVPGIAGLQAGVKYVKKMEPQQIFRHEQQLLRKLVNELAGVKKIKLYHSEKNQAGVLAINGPMASENLAELLSAEGVCTRAGLHCAPLAHQSAGTLPDGAVRISFSSFNTWIEVQKTAAILRRLISSQ